MRACDVGLEEAQHPHDARQAHHHAPVDDERADAVHQLAEEPQVGELGAEDAEPGEGDVGEEDDLEAVDEAEQVLGQARAQRVEGDGEHLVHGRQPPVQDAAGRRQAGHGHEQQVVVELEALGAAQAQPEPRAGGGDGEGVEDPDDDLRSVSRASSEGQESWTHENGLLRDAGRRGRRRGREVEGRRHAVVGRRRGRVRSTNFSKRRSRAKTPGLSSKREKGNGQVGRGSSQGATVTTNGASDIS